MVYNRTPEDLRKAAEIQLQGIQVSARAFDDGLIGEAARLATAVFILVGRGMRHHTSIFDAAGQQEKRQYRSTIATSGQQDSPLIQCSLKKEAKDGWSITLNPAGRDRLYTGRDIPFSEWWSELVVINDKHSLSRENIIRILRDKNGGAHFDISIADDLTAAALRGDLGGFYYIQSEGDVERPVEGSLEMCMRQIVEELWFSMEQQLI